MCGIVGYVGQGNRSMLNAMCSAISHRGPDDEGFFVGVGVGLGMRRLSIIDLTGGNQPISNENGSVVVVFNGEIYNFEELRNSLVGLGHKFSTKSDTETIVHLYEQYDMAFLHHLRGMFGIALWDEKRKRLVLARDRIGEKPLFYRLDKSRNQILFGSEIKAILTATNDREINAQAVCQFIAAGYIPAPNTMFKDIYKLPPGALLIFEKGEAIVQRYWSKCRGGDSNITFNDACQKAEGLLTQSVELCLKSDVEVGAFLSGGLDSSLIVGIIKSLGVNVKTFSVGYDGAVKGFNELSFAKRVANGCKTTHHELILKSNTTIELLPRILWHFDEPHGEPSSVLVYLLSAFARNHVKVVMGGTGGDEIFYGYPKHIGLRLLEYYKQLPRFFRQEMVERVLYRWPESTKGSRFIKRAKRFIAGAGFAPEDAYLNWTSLFRQNVREKMFTQQALSSVRDLDGDYCLRQYLFAFDRGTILDRVADMETGAYLSEYQLTYIDRMTMASSLEARSPLCDWKLVDFITSLPANFRLKELRSKHLLKTVAEKWVEKRIVERKKVGFDSPIGQWIKDELRDFILAFLSVKNLNRTGIFNAEVVCKLINQHLAGLRDYSLQLWSIVMVEAWHRMFIEDRVGNICEYGLVDMRH